MAEFAAPRSTNLPLPAWRYRPGCNRRPDAGPTAAPVRLPAPDRWAMSALYLYGCDLYNHAYWWEAHEAWEDLWRLAARGDLRRDYLQGLIQVSACALKMALGNHSGARRLLDRAGGYLDRVVAAAEDGHFMGLDLVGWRARLRAYYEPRIEKSLDHDPAEFPYVRLSPGRRPGDPEAAKRPRLNRDGRTPSD